MSALWAIPVALLALWFLTPSLWLFPTRWRDRTTGRMYVRTRKFSDAYGQWQEVVRVVGPLWRAAKFAPFRDHACNFERVV